MAENTVSDLKATDPFALREKPVGGTTQSREPNTAVPSQATMVMKIADANASRSSPHASTGEIFSLPATTLQTADEEANGALLARFDRLTRHRDRVLTLRVQLDYERSRLDDCRRFFSESVEALMQHLPKSSDDSSLPPAEVMMHVKRDYDVLAQQNLLVSRQGHELNEREYKLARLEGHFCRKARQVLGSMFPEKSFAIPGALSGARRFDGSEESSEVPTSIDIDPLLQAYFDALGDVGVYGERLVELDFEYREELTQRNLREDQELPVDPPEHEFEQHYRDEQTQIKSDLSRAMLKAENLHQSCIQRGLDPDETRRTSSGGQSSYVSSTVSSEVSVAPSRDINQLFEALAGREVLASHHAMRFSLPIADVPEDTDQGAQSEDQLNLDVQKMNAAKIEGWREAIEPQISDPLGDGHFEELRSFEVPNAATMSESICASQSQNHDEGYRSHSRHGSVVTSHEHVIQPVRPLSPPNTIILQHANKLGNNQVDRVPAILPTRQLVRTFSDPELQRLRIAEHEWKYGTYKFYPPSETISKQAPMESEQQSSR